MSDDLPAIRAGLAERLEILAEVLLGAPTQRSRREWRWGSKGSTALVIEGAKRGSWHDHEAGVGGGPLDLVMHARRAPIADAIAWARGWCGLADDRARTPDRDHAERLRDDADRRAREAAREAAKREGFARVLFEKSEPIAGTLAETYLAGRGIRAESPPGPGWPPDVRYHRGSRALLVAARRPDGAVAGVHRVLLDEDGRKLTPERATDGVVKPSNGVFEGAAVCIPGRAPLLVAEGPETGLSVWSATFCETWIALGSIARLNLPRDRVTVICRDDDPLGSPAALRLQQAVAAWRRDGSRVAVATPWRRRRYDKSDFNDALCAAGPSHVASRIERAVGDAA